MRIALTVIGIILLGLGIWVVAGNPSYKSTEASASAFGHSAQLTEQHAIPRWAGIAGIVVGGVLIIGGLATRRRR